MNEIFNFDNLGYKEKDALQDVLDSYKENVEFDIEKLREERLRFLFKERYDYRTNLIDWDYQMKTRKFMDFLGYQCYKRFRLSGVVLQKHLSDYIKPNKTLSSYIPGRSVRKFLYLYNFNKKIQIYLKNIRKKQKTPY